MDDATAPEPSPEPDQIPRQSQRKRKDVLKMLNHEDQSTLPEKDAEENMAVSEAVAAVQVSFTTTRPQYTWLCSNGRT